MLPTSDFVLSFRACLATISGPLDRQRALPINPWTFLGILLLYTDRFRTRRALVLIQKNRAAPILCQGG